MKFTDTAIRALKPGENRYEVWEDGRPGFGMRVSPQGRKSFVYFYRLDGRLRRWTVGAYPRLSLRQAHLMQARAVVDIAEGKDPAGEKIMARQAERQAPIFDQVIDEFLADPENAKKQSIDQTKRFLDVEVRPVWGRRKAKNITRRDVILLRDNIRRRGSPVTSNRTMTIVGQIFNYCLDHDILGSTPFVRIGRATEQSRERYLTEEEIKGFWLGLAQADMSNFMRLALKLVLATGQRRGEVAATAWSEIDLDERVWEIPGAKTKNGRPHLVPLSDVSVTILTELRRLNPDHDDNPRRDWLFPSRTNVGKPVTPRAITRAMAKNRGCFDLVDEDVAPTVHDLRRSASTHMGRLRVPRFVIERILNHADATTTAIYDRWMYLPEKREALDAWAAELQRIVKQSSLVKPGEVAELRSAVI